MRFFHISFFVIKGSWFRLTLFFFNRVCLSSNNFKRIPKILNWFNFFYVIPFTSTFTVYGGGFTFKQNLCLSYVSLFRNCRCCKAMKNVGTLRELIFQKTNFPEKILKIYFWFLRELIFLKESSSIFCEN